MFSTLFPRNNISAQMSLCICYYGEEMSQRKKYGKYWPSGGINSSDPDHWTTTIADENLSVMTQVNIFMTRLCFIFIWLMFRLPHSLTLSKEPVLEVYSSPSQPPRETLRISLGLEHCHKHLPSYTSEQFLHVICRLCGWICWLKWTLGVTANV